VATLKSALADRFAAVSGGTPPLYFDEAPDDADPGAAPYVVYLLIEAAPTLTTGDDIIQAIEAQFSAFGPSAPDVEAIGALLRQAFDPTSSRARMAWDHGYEMTTSPLGGRTIRERRTSTLPDRGPGGGSAWHRLERFQLLTCGALGLVDHLPGGVGGGPPAPVPGAGGGGVGGGGGGGDGGGGGGSVADPETAPYGTGGYGRVPYGGGVGSGGVGGGGVGGGGPVAGAGTAPFGAGSYGRIPYGGS
jgi:hypothetical protein